MTAQRAYVHNGQVIPHSSRPITTRLSDLLTSLTAFFTFFWFSLFSVYSPPFAIELIPILRPAHRNHKIEIMESEGETVLGEVQAVGRQPEEEEEEEGLVALMMLGAVSSVHDGTNFS